MKVNSDSTIINKVLLLFLFLSVIPFLILTIFTNPLYDDYCFAVTTLKHGFWGAQSDWYNNWTGRYASTAIISFHPLIFGSFTGYKLISLMIILLTCISIFYFVSAFLGKEIDLERKLLLTGFLVTLFLNNMPDTVDGLYWLPGEISYQLGNILTLFLLAVLIKAAHSSPIKRIILFAVNLFLTIIIVGLSETSLVFIVLLIGLITAEAFFKKGKMRLELLILLIISVLFSLIVIFAPGNAVRESLFPNNHRLFFSIGMSVAQMVRFISSWLSNPVFILSSILFIPFSEKILSESKVLRTNLQFNPLVSLALLPAIVFLGFFPAYWATGMMGQHRSVNVAYFFFLLGWFINIIICVNYYNSKFKKSLPDLPVYFYIIAIPLIMLSLFTTNNTKNAFLDLLTGRAYKYDQELRKKQTRFKECAESKNADCPPQEITSVPTILTNPKYLTLDECDLKYWNNWIKMSGKSFE